MPAQDDEFQISTREPLDMASVGDCPWEVRSELGPFRWSLALSAWNSSRMEGFKLLLP